MKVRDLMTPHPEVCVPTDSCAVAGEIMARRNCGFVPIVEGLITMRVVGVLTDRDLALHLVHAGCPAERISVEVCMTGPAKTISPDADLDEAVRLMESGAIHRLPVVESGRLIGILSLKDIASFARSASALAGAGRVERQVAEIVEAISTAR